MLDKFGSLGRSILGNLVELEGKPEEPQAAPQVKPGTPPVKGPATAAPVTTHVSYDQTMLEMLQKKIAARPTPYTALLDNARVLEDIIPDEATRLIAAFKTINKDGTRSVSSINSAIDVHLTDIDGELMRFKQATDKQVKEKSGALRGQAATLEATNNRNSTEIERLEAQAAKLRDEINMNAQRIVELNHEADVAESEIVNTAAAFERTVEFVKQDLLGKKASLSSVLAKV